MQFSSSCLNVERPSCKDVRMQYLSRNKGQHHRHISKHRFSKFPFDRVGKMITIVPTLVAAQLCKQKIYFVS